MSNPQSPEAQKIPSFSPLTPDTMSLADRQAALPGGRAFTDKAVL